MTDGIDLSAFDTPASISDVDAVRAALGYERIAIYGTSYGARLALQVARTHPDRIESIALSSPVPAEANYVLDAGASFDAALQRVHEACAADPACAASYPDVAGTAAAVAANLDAQPLSVPGEGGEPTTFDGSAFAGLLFSLMYDPVGHLVVPYVVSTVSSGDIDALTTVSGRASGTPAPMSLGVQLSFVCAEEVAAAGPAPTFATGDLGLGQRLVEFNVIAGPTVLDVCRTWAVEPGDPSTFEPVRTDVPMLVVTGQFDHVTPPAYGQAVAQAASTAWYVEIPSVGHSPVVAAGECGIAILSSFLDAPTAQPDTSCLPAATTFPTPEEVADLFASPAG